MKTLDFFGKAFSGAFAGPSKEEIPNEQGMKDAGALELPPQAGSFPSHVPPGSLPLNLPAGSVPPNLLPDGLPSGRPASDLTPLIFDKDMSAEDQKILGALRMDHISSVTGVQRFTTDVINGLVPNLQRGSLTLVPPRP